MKWHYLLMPSTKPLRERSRSDMRIHLRYTYGGPDAHWQLRGQLSSLKWWMTLQNTWIKVFRKIDTVNGHFKGWVYKVLENEFTDEIRKQTGRDEKIRIVSIDARDPWEIDGDAERPGKVEREINSVHREQSAEDAAFAGNEETAQTGFVDLARRFLTNSDAEFFIKYQEETGVKSPADKKRYFDYRSKMMVNMINQWLAHDRRLEEIMSWQQAEALTRRFSLDQKQSQIFKEMGLCSKGELKALLASATSLLLQALTDEYPET